MFTRNRQRAGIRRAVLALALSAAAMIRAASAAAQESAPSMLLLPVPTLGSEAYDRIRLDNLRDPDSGPTILLRAYSDGVRSALGERSVAFGALLPELRTRYSSRLPMGGNDGSLRPGRGWYVQAIGGAFAHVGPLTIVLAPEINYEANGLPPLLPDSLGGDSVSVPWYRETVDLPVRFGSGSATRLLPGQSSARLDFGAVSAGISTENEWWGPGLLDALVLSDNAPGFPHAFLRTARPIAVGIGTIEGRLLAGDLTGSGFFNEPDSTTHRSLSAAALVFRPTGAPGLSLGVARSVYGPAADRGDAAGRFAEALTRWWLPDTTAIAADRPERAQILSFFGRWAFPADGLELYGEWARTHLPTSIGAFLQAPGYSQAYTLGFQWLRDVTATGAVRVQTEASFLDRSSRTGPRESFYTSAEVPAGYTNDGQILGAATGPGSSSQRIAADYITPSARLGAFVGRTRWSEDSYLTRTSPWPFLGHDVSVYGGIRASYSMGGVRLEGTLSRGQRMNYLFQNWSKSWEAAAKDAVNISNTRFETRLSYTGTPQSTPPPPLRPSALSSLVEPVGRPEIQTSAPQMQRETVPQPTAALPTHRVLKGETLFSIARRYGVTVDTLRTANRITGDRIFPGQVLSIPVP